LNWDDAVCSGLVRPPLGDAIECCNDATAATHVLIATRQRGVDVPRRLIRDRVFAARDARLWEHYAFLDEQAAADLLDLGPEVVCHAGQGLLARAPHRTLETLMRADEAGVVKSDGDTHHPHRLIAEWISEWDHEAHTVSRRVVLLEVLERVQASAPLTPATLLKYLAVALDPDLHGIKSSPVERNTVVWRRGVHSEASLREIAGLWPRILKLLPVQIVPAWTRFLDTVGNWAWPGRGAPGVPETKSEFMHQTARGFVADLAALPQCGRALR
jgi:hypothetical protein